MAESTTTFTFDQITTTCLGEVPDAGNRLMHELCVRTLIRMSRRDGFMPRSGDGRLDDEVGHAATEKVGRCGEACRLKIVTEGLTTADEEFGDVEIAARCEDVVVEGLEGIQPAVDTCQARQRTVLSGLGTALRECIDELNEYK
jgi:hypothetical protein